ncbi:acyl--CoA ligase [bacterium]|nr:acyl--CoA ligase [bacterium]
MLKYFEKYKNKTAVINGNEIYTYYEIKNQISWEVENLKSKKENVVILSGDNFSFIIQFFASLYCDKNVYLLTDKTRLKDLKCDFDILESATGNEIKKYDFPDIDIKKGAVNFFTSGSTGKPKNIKKSLFNLIREAQDIGETFEFKDKNYTVKSTTTMCHLFGLTFHLMTSLCNGLTIDVKEVAYPENVDGDNTILVSTPTFLHSADKYNLDFKSCPKYIISAGSKLEEKVFEKLEKNSKITEIYGSSETGVIAYKTHFCNDFKIFDNVKLKVNYENVEVFSDYAYGFETVINDKIEVENDRLKFKLRTDRMFKINEKRVSAQELENALNKNEFVQESYITKSEDKLVCLCALSNRGKDYLLENKVSDLTKILKQNLMKTSEIVPQRWKYTDEIPKNSMGKINKKLIEHLFNVNLSMPVILGRKVEKENIKYRLLIYSQCNFFKGHFPSFQLVPGVVQLYWAKEFANAHFNLELGAGQWKRIKFSNIIKPDNIINLRLEKNEKSVFYEYFSDDKKYASGVFLCENIFKDLRSGNQ